MGNGPAGKGGIQKKTKGIKFRFLGYRFPTQRKQGDRVAVYFREISHLLV